MRIGGARGDDEMVRVTARAHVARVVEFGACWNVANEERIRDAVDALLSAVDAYDAVAVTS